MLHHAHQLHRVIASADNVRQHVTLELRIAAALWLLGAHADVRLVDAQVFGLRGTAEGYFHEKNEQYGKMVNSEESKRETVIV